MENRLVSRTGAATANLRYDPLGRLYETGGGAAGITRFLYDGDELVAEYNGAGTLLRRYVHGSSVDDPLAVFEGSGVADSAARLVKTNHQGSVIALTDWNGNLLSKNSYDEWGIPGSTNASISAGGRFAYTGQAWIPELGMYHYKARIYSPTLGRFMQTDPVGYKDQMNLYGYVGNDPVNFVDPDGLEKVCVGTTGKLTQSCVSVDGNGDGKTNDNDLSRSQENQIKGQFTTFIQNNNGANLSGHGKEIRNVDASANEVTMSRVVSQFVGYALRGNTNWTSVSYILVGKDQGAFGYAPSSWCGGNSAVACQNVIGTREMQITGQRMSWLSGTSYAPSQLARLMFHEMLHFKYGALSSEADRAAHARLDAEARGMLKRNGIADGGCSGQLTMDPLGYGSC